MLSRPPNVASECVTEGPNFLYLGLILSEYQLTVYDPTEPAQNRIVNGLDDSLLLLLKAANVYLESAGSLCTLQTKIGLTQNTNPNSF